VPTARRRWVSAVCGVAVLALGCADETPPQEVGDESSGITVTPTEAGDDGMKFDVEDAPETGTGADDGSTATGCRLVDAIIAVDNSSSMAEEIEALAGPVFDSFPQTLLDVNNGLDDFQLGVIDACNNPAYLHDTGAAGACDYSTGKNFMVSSSPALIDEYQCATAFTTAGFHGQEDGCSGDNDDEQPANTAADAVSPPAASDQNAGFVRDDAVLFVVAITDEDEQPTPPRTAQEIVDEIVAAKGDIANVVFLGIGGDSSCNGPYGSAEEAVLLREVAGIFAAANRGLFWDLCQGDLEAAFQAALQIVDSACMDFTPVG
jgi:hypothetical protein